jgi:uncharacterized damage-inducible protein DinB
MNSVDTVRRMQQHRSWVNQRLLDAAQQLPQEQVQQSFAIGQGTIWKSLVHLYAAEYVWLEALQGNEQAVAPGDVPGKLPGNQEGERRIASLEDLASRWDALDKRWEQYLSTLTPERLDDVVYKVRSTGGRFAFRRFDIFLHVYAHTQYTVAQIVNMMRHADATALPDPMVITMARGEPPVG